MKSTPQILEAVHGHWCSVLSTLLKLYEYNLVLRMLNTLGNITTLPIPKAMVNYIQELNDNIFVNTGLIPIAVFNPGPFLDQSLGVCL